MGDSYNLLNAPEPERIEITITKSRLSLVVKNWSSDTGVDKIISSINVRNQARSSKSLSQFCLPGSAGAQ